MYEFWRVGAKITYLITTRQTTGENRRRESGGTGAHNKNIIFMIRRSFAQGVIIHIYYPSAQNQSLVTIF